MVCMTSLIDGNSNYLHLLLQVCHYYITCGELVWYRPKFLTLVNHLIEMIDGRERIRYYMVVSHIVEFSKML